MLVVVLGGGGCGDTMITTIPPPPKPQPQVQCLHLFTTNVNLTIITSHNHRHNQRTGPHHHHYRSAPTLTPALLSDAGLGERHAGEVLSRGHRRHLHQQSAAWRENSARAWVLAPASWPMWYFGPYFSSTSTRCRPQKTSETS